MYQYKASNRRNWVGGIWDSVPSSQFLCKSKTIPKNKVYFKNGKNILKNFKME